MPYKVPQNRTKDIQRLSRALKAKQQQLSTLEADHHQLSHRHYLLAASCDLLQLLASLKESANRTHSLNEPQQPTATAESELLQQLRGLQYQQKPLLSHTNLNRDHSYDFASPSGSLPSGSSSCSSNSSHDPFSLLHLEESESLGTFEDPLRALRLQLLREDIDPYPGIQELTIEQMQVDYRSLIHQLALNVGFLDNPIVRSRDDDNNPYAAIKRLVCSHNRVLTALLLRGRSYMIPLFFMSNVVSGQQVEEHDPMVYDHAASKLGLTATQRQNIQGILSVFRSLLGGVLEKRFNVQFVLALASSAGINSCVPGSFGGMSVPSVPGLAAVDGVSSSIHSGGTSGGSPAVGSGSIGTKSAEALSKVALSQQQHQLLEERQQQQQNITQVVRLLQKESLLKACCWSSIEGCLTWTQLAKLLISCYPFRPSPLALAQAVERSLAAE